MFHNLTYGTIDSNGFAIRRENNFFAKKLDRVAQKEKHACLAAEVPKKFYLKIAFVITEF